MKNIVNFDYVETDSYVLFTSSKDDLFHIFPVFFGEAVVKLYGEWVAVTDAPSFDPFLEGVNREARITKFEKFIQAPQLEEAAAAAEAIAA